MKSASAAPSGHSSWRTTSATATAKSAFGVANVSWERGATATVQLTSGPAALYPVSDGEGPVAYLAVGRGGVRVFTESSPRRADRKNTYPPASGTRGAASHQHFESGVKP